MRDAGFARDARLRRVGRTHRITDHSAAASRITYLQTYLICRWEHKDGRFNIACDVPVGATATLWLPFEGAVPEFEESENVIRKGVREGYALYKVRSGHYEFETAL